MNYRAHYDRLIERARGRVIDGYTERHHVKPRCLGGTDEADNLVRLTPEEHYVAHLLLVKIHDGDYRLVWAAVRTARGLSGRRNKMVGWLRRRLAEANRSRIFSIETRAKMSASQKMRKAKGHTKPHSEATKRKMSAASKGRKKSVMHRAALSVAKMGKACPHTAEWEAKRLAALRASGEKMSAAHRRRYASDEARALTAEKMKEVWAKRRSGEMPMPATCRQRRV